MFEILSKYTIIILKRNSRLSLVTVTKNADFLFMNNGLLIPESTCAGKYLFCAYDTYGKKKFNEIQN